MINRYDALNDILKKLPKWQWDILPGATDKDKLFELTNLLEAAKREAILLITEEIGK